MSVSFKDYYETLGVARDASSEDIKRAFRKLARKWHPDKAKPEDRPAAEAKFKEINEAYEVLKDPEKRRKYDQLGANWEQYQDAGEPAGGGAGGFGQRRGGPGGPSPEDFEFHFGGTGFSDFFERFFGMGGMGGAGAGPGADPFGDPFAQTRQRRPRHARGGDLEAELMVTLEEVARGATRPITFSTVNPDTGQEETREFKVRIPPGAREGQRLRVAGHGEIGRGGGPAGDLYLRVKYAQHPDFSVRGSDLRHELELAPWEAVLGAAADVPTLDGSARLKIPAGSSGGRQLRLRGKGLPTPEGGRGDLYITLSIAIPQRLNDKERALWEELAETSSFSPRERR